MAVRGARRHAGEPLEQRARALGLSSRVLYELQVLRDAGALCAHGWGASCTTASRVVWAVVFFSWSGVRGLIHALRRHYPRTLGLGSWHLLHAMRRAQFQFLQLGQIVEFVYDIAMLRRPVRRKKLIFHSG